MMSDINTYKFEAWFSQEGFQKSPLIDIDEAIELIGQLREICGITDIIKHIDKINIWINNQVFSLGYWKSYKIWLGWNDVSGQEFILSSLNDLILAINSVNWENIQKRETIMETTSRYMYIGNTEYIRDGNLRIGDKYIFVTATHSPRGKEYYILNQSHPYFDRPIFMSKKKRAIINYLIHNIRRPDN